MKAPATAQDLEQRIQSIADYCAARLRERLTVLLAAPKGMTAPADIQAKLAHVWERFPLNRPIGEIREQLDQMIRKVEGEIASHHQSSMFLVPLDVELPQGVAAKARSQAGNMIVRVVYVYEMMEGRFLLSLSVRYCYLPAPDSSDALLS